MFVLVTVTIIIVFACSIKISVRIGTIHSAGRFETAVDFRNIENMFLIIIIVFLDTFPVKHFYEKLFSCVSFVKFKDTWAMVIL